MVEILQDSLARKKTGLTASICLRAMSSPSVRPLSPSLQEAACRELNEDPTRREQDLAHVKEWLKKQPHIKARTDNQWLLTFLRGCKFSLERTKEKLDTYYTMRTMLPEFFSNRDPMLPAMQEVLNLGVCVPLPCVDSKGRRVVLNRVGMTDPHRIRIQDVFKTNLMIIDILLMEDDAAVVHGHIDLMDLRQVTLGHAGQITPAFAKKAVTCFQDGFPLRPQGINYINTPPMFDTVFNLFKIAMKEKLKKRVFIHGANMESLHQNIPQHILPSEYGGQAGNIADLAAEWKKKVESYRDFFLADEKNKTDEKKRPGKPKTQESLFGIEGSFRQLNVD